MKSKNGFTLVELLVVIVILGVVTGISIPLLRNVQENNKLRQYTTYADSLKQSAKLYIDSYGEDMFGKRTSGCTFVSYADMQERGYIKDIQIDGMSCNSNNTFVKVVKTNNVYVYTVYLGCGKKKNNKVDSVTMTYPEMGHIYTMDTTSCNMKGTTMAVSMGSTVAGSILQTQVATVSIVSPTGINNNASIYAAWSKSTSFTSVSWTKANMSIPTGQAGKINAGENIYAESQQFVTPSGENGEYYLLVKVENLEDLSGAHWKNPQTANSPYIYFGPVKVDNTKPTCKLKVTTSGVAFDTKSDNMELKEFGLGNSATANYNSKELVSLANGTFYGYVKDTAGNTNTCSATIGGTTPSKYTKVTKLCSGSDRTATGNYNVGQVTTYTQPYPSENPGRCTSHESVQFTTCDSHSIGKRNVKFESFQPTATNIGTCFMRVETCIVARTVQCSLSTCSELGCTCTGGYTFGAETTTTNVAAPCTENKFDTCDSAHNNVNYVACTPTEYACATTGYTKLNNTYCYKIN